MHVKYWTQQRVLVAGGAGFIGSHLIERLLASGCRVVCLDSFQTGRFENIAHLDGNPRFSLVKADVVDPLPASLRPDVVFNLACAASPPLYQADPIHTMLTNVLGTRNLLALAWEWNARFVLASTSEVYGDPLEHPQREGYCGNVNPIGPRACYDEGKRAAETLTFDYRRSRGLDVRVARIFNTYGPRMRADDGRVISNLVCQALAGADITIYGDGTQTRSFCYIDDLVEGLLRLAAAREAPATPVNLGNPVELTISQLATKVVELTASRSRLIHAPLPVDDPQRRRPDITLAGNVLSWRPKVELTAGLQKTVAWFRSEIGEARPRGAKARGCNGDDRRARSGAGAALAGSSSG